MSGAADIIKTYDGKSLDLRLPGLNAVLSGNGYGIPEINYQTQRGYKQHGETLLGWRAQPRKIILTVQVAGRNYEAYLSSRQQLWDFLRPNRGGALTLRKVFRDGTTRDIDAWFSGGGDGSDSPENPIITSETMSLEFQAFDPSFYDPLVKTAAMGASAPAGLIFPAAFGAIEGQGGWVFRSEAEIGAVSATYNGTWYSWPIITLTGPYDWVRLTNLTTGAIINLTVAKVTGETVVLDLTPGAQTVKDGNGVDIFDNLQDANLIDFYLSPDPEAAGGVNSIRFEAANSTVATTISVQYFERYEAL